MRVGRALERERLLHVRAQAALVDERRHVLAEVVAARAHEDVVDLVVAVAGLRGRAGDRDQPAARRSEANACSRGVAAEQVERGVGARVRQQVAHARGEILGRVVERLGPELAQEVVVALGRGRDHARAARDRELDREVADAAGAAADEQRLAAAQAERLERLVGGQRRGAASPPPPRTTAPRGMCAKKPSGAVAYSA